MRVESRPIIKITKEEEEIIFKVYNGVIKAYALDEKSNCSETFTTYLESIFDIIISDGLEHTHGNTSIELED